jgi:hypothetical protein
VVAMQADYKEIDFFVPGTYQIKNKETGYGYRTVDFYFTGIKDND